MKRYLIPILITILVLTSRMMIGCSQETSPTSRKTYTNAIYGYSIEYPSSWRLDESGETVHIYRPLHEHISIGVVEMEMITDEDLKWLVENMNEELASKIDKFQLINKAKLYETGYPTWEMVYTGKTKEGLALNFKCRCIAYRDRVYVITIGAPESELPSSLNSALNSFTFQKQAGEELEDLFAYWDKIYPLGEEYLKAITAVLEADADVLEVIKSQDEYSLLEVEFIYKNTVNEALATVFSVQLKMSEIIPPEQAQLVHNLMNRSLSKAGFGLMKLDYGTEICYNKAYCMLHPCENQDFPDTSEIMREGRQNLREALDIWEEVEVEMDNLQQVLEQKVKN